MKVMLFVILFFLNIFFCCFHKEKENLKSEKILINTILIFYCWRLYCVPALLSYFSCHQIMSHQKLYAMLNCISVFKAYNQH